jgi:LacI family transcriptional regulator
MNKKDRHPTLSEVAKLAGVGTTTVSRVINGSARVDPKTLARVRTVIDQLGYMPNQAARSLRGRPTRMIGFLIPSVADPFFSSCAEAAQAIAHENGSLLIVTTTQNDPGREIEGINILMQHRVDGLIISPGHAQNPALCDALTRWGVPAVAIDRPLLGGQTPSVVVDNFAAARLATRHLIEHGRLHVVCLTGEPALYTIQERLRGYRSAVKAAGLPCIVDTSIEDQESTERAIKRLLEGKTPPDALFTLKNSTTMLAFEVMQRLNIVIPDKIAIVGYDDFDLAATVRPSITVIQQPVTDIGAVGAKLLFRQLTRPGKNTESGNGQAEQVQLKARLIRRESCGCAAPAAQDRSA